VTVNNPSGKLDWRTAGRAALLAVPGLSDGQVATLLAMRGQSLYTPDAATLETLAKIGSGAEPDLAQNATGGRAVTVQIAISHQSLAHLQGEVVLQLTGGGATPFHILEWRVPALMPFAS
jgi:hypothetical protein